MSRGLLRERNPNWRGGRTKQQRGYVLIRVGVGHPLAHATGYAYEHRLIAAASGQDVVGKQVHHIDEDRGNNAPTNLEALTDAEHHVRHRVPGCKRRHPDEANPMVSCLCGCGATFVKYDSKGRARAWVHGHDFRAKPSPIQDAVLSALSGFAAQRADIIAATGLPAQSVKKALAGLSAAGLVRSPRRGLWEKVPDSGEMSVTVGDDLPF